jgi:hypothetical protein
MFTPAGAELARTMGRETGSGYAREVTALLGTGTFRFSYDLGRLVGPTMVHVVLAFLGLPVLVVACVRIARVLWPILHRFPWMQRLLASVTGRRGGRRLPGGRRTRDNRQLPGDRRRRVERQAPGERQEAGERQLAGERQPPDDRESPSERQQPGERQPPDERQRPTARRLPPSEPVVLTPEEMRDFLRSVWDGNPILRRIAGLRPIAQLQRSTNSDVLAESLRARCIDILRQFKRETGMRVEVVDDEAVQAIRGWGDTASIRSRLGHLQVERSTYRDAQQLYAIVRHDLVFYYAGGPEHFLYVPELGRIGDALTLLEWMIEGYGTMPEVLLPD